MILSIIIAAVLLELIVALSSCQVAKDSRCNKCGKIVPEGKDFCEECEK